MPTVYVELEILFGIPKLVICAMPLLEHIFLVNSSVHPYQLSSQPRHTLCTRAYEIPGPSFPAAYVWLGFFVRSKSNML